MRKYYLFIFLLLPLCASAQSNFKSGYVINLNGDTLRGFINLKEWANTPQTIEFRSSATNRSKQLGKADINYFEISGYIRCQLFPVTISTNPFNDAAAAGPGDTTSIAGTVFLKVLEKGKYLNLYAYKDGIKERYYIKDNSASVPTELIYGVYRDPNTENGTIEKNSYRAQLLQIAEKYNVSTDNLIHNVQQSRYKDYTLIPVVAQINGDKAGVTVSISPSGNPSVRFYAGAALVSSSLKFPDGVPFNGAANYTSTSPKIVIGADLFANPDVGRLIFRMEVGYFSVNYKFTDQSDLIFNEMNPSIYSEDFKMNVLRFTPQVVYNFYNAPALKVFLDAGYALNVLSYPSTAYVTTTSGTVVATQQVKGLAASRSNSSSFIFKGGIVISKRFEIYADYCLSSQITNSLTYSTGFTTMDIGANYFIGKVAK